MEWVIWLVIMVPVSAVFTGIGVYALRLKKPMWFWSGTTVKEEEISDVRAYNRANGVMWLSYSAILWASTLAGIWRTAMGGILLFVGTLLGMPALVITYGRIYKRYKR